MIVDMNDVRNAFMIQHFVLGLAGLLAVVVPDVPADVKVQISRER